MLIGDETMLNKEIETEITQMCKNFKLLREKKRISKKELSKTSGVNEHIIISFENGIITKHVNVTHLFKLCCFFKIEVHKIFSPLEL